LEEGIGEGKEDFGVCCLLFVVSGLLNAARFYKRWQVFRHQGFAIPDVILIGFSIRTK